MRERLGLRRSGHAGFGVFRRLPPPYLVEVIVVDAEVVGDLVD